MGFGRREFSPFERVVLPFLFGLSLAAAFLFINMIINAARYKRSDPMIHGFSKEAMAGITVAFLVLGWLTGTISISCGRRRSSVNNHQSSSVTDRLLADVPPETQPEANSRITVSATSAPATEVSTITVDTLTSTSSSNAATAMTFAQGKGNNTPPLSAFGASAATVPT